MSDKGLEITIAQSGPDAAINAEVWCPNFVAHHEADSVEEALIWARRRIDEVDDPFAEYEED